MFGGNSKRDICTSPFFGIVGDGIDHAIGDVVQYAVNVTKSNGTETNLLNFALDIGNFDNIALKKNIASNNEKTVDNIFE